MSCKLVFIIGVDFLAVSSTYNSLNPFNKFSSDTSYKFWTGSPNSNMLLNLGSPKCIIPNGLSLNQRPSNALLATFFHPPYLAVNSLANKSRGLSPPPANEPRISLNHVIAD